jgi:hypothetical protein
MATGTMGALAQSSSCVIRLSLAGLLLALPHFRLIPYACVSHRLGVPVLYSLENASLPIFLFSFFFSFCFFFSFLFLYLCHILYHDIGSVLNL